MNTKLTLSLDIEIIEKAKQYAKRNNMSLSALVENYFSRLTQEYNESEIRPSLVEEMSGIIELENDFDYKKELGEYHTKKYK